MSVIFTEASGVAESIYGNVQAPIQLFLEEQDAAYEKESLLPALFKMGKSENFGDLLTGHNGTGFGNLDGIVFKVNIRPFQGQ